MNYDSGIYVTIDTVAEKESSPWSSPNDRSAIRAFHEGLKSSPYPKDFTLVRLGYVGKPWSLYSDVSVLWDKDGQHTDILDEDIPNESSAEVKREF